VFGDTIGEYLFRSPHAMRVAFLVMFNIFALAIVLVLLTWLLARHVGRTFGGFRPDLCPSGICRASDFSSPVKWPGPTRPSG
jgi:hypothetical protein